VVVQAHGRIGPALAALLAASGVGRVHVQGRGKVVVGDACPGGLLANDEHRPYALAAADAVRRAAPEVDTRPLGPHRRPDLVVLADARRRSPAGGRARLVRGIPHLPVGLRDGTAVVGPLIVPGTTACLDCIELHRLDRDPVWPALAAQLSTSRDEPDPSHQAIAAGAAALAAAQVLCLLDGGQPEALGRSLELTGVGERLRRRAWEPHPACACAGAPLRPSA
jgi:bacteriocin biosynthesis cyclodehydratase domain-containing protein